METHRPPKNSATRFWLTHFSVSSSSLILLTRSCASSSVSIRLISLPSLTSPCGTGSAMPRPTSNLSASVRRVGVGGRSGPPELDESLLKMNFEGVVIGLELGRGGRRGEGEAGTSRIVCRCWYAAEGTDEPLSSSSSDARLTVGGSI